MSYFRKGDPLDDFDQLDAKNARWLESLPVCGNCGNPIQNEHYYVINDENICPECLDNDFRVENNALNQ